jgi:hypothetical protein
VTVAALLARAAAAGVRLHLDGGRVRLAADAPPPADLLADLRGARAGGAAVPRAEAERAGDLLVVLLWDALNGQACARGLPDNGTDGPIYAATDMLAWREAVNWPGLFDAEGRSVVAARMAEDGAAEAGA